MMHDFTYQIININYISGGPRHARYIDVSCINKLKLIMQKPFALLIHQIEKTICLLVFDNIGNIIIGIVTLLNYYVYFFPTTTLYRKVWWLNISCLSFFIGSHTSFISLINHYYIWENKPKRGVVLWTRAWLCICPIFMPPLFHQL